MKYSWEDKIKAVKYYLKYGCIEYPESCITNFQKTTYRNYVQLWKSQYLLNGEEGLKHKEFNKVYSPEEKYAIIKPILDAVVSAKEQSHRTGINIGQLYSWKKKYQEKGWDGLKCSKCGRPGKNMKQVKEEQTPKTTEPVSDDELKKKCAQLEHENLLLKFEVEYLKKLEALDEKKAKKKQKSSKSSSKAKNSKRK